MKTSPRRLSPAITYLLEVGQIVVQFRGHCVVRSRGYFFRHHYFASFCGFCLRAMGLRNLVQRFGGHVRGRFIHVGSLFGFGTILSLAL